MGVPAGASHLFLSVHDGTYGFFGNNTDPNSDFHAVFSVVTPPLLHGSEEHCELRTGVNGTPSASPDVKPASPFATLNVEVAQRFVLTLVPIAIGYHVAHYLVFLLVQGQYIVPLLSDPFGYGWNLFGTSGYRVDIGLVGARFAWYAAVASIVLGHVVAVYLAHVKAIGLFDAPGTALKSQVPLTALMVAYTFIGLSIAAQPIVESRAAATPSAVASETVEVPPDAVVPREPDGRLVAPTLKTARVKLAYKVLGSAFHDGSKTSVADLLYAYAFAYRSVAPAWPVRTTARAGRLAVGIWTAAVFSEFMGPFNVLHQPLALSLVAWAFWAVPALAAAGAIATVIDRGERNTAPSPQMAGPSPAHAGRR